jgi:hypothetical protein
MVGRDRTTFEKLSRSGFHTRHFVFRLKPFDNQTIFIYNTYIVGYVMRCGKVCVSKTLRTSPEEWEVMLTALMNNKCETNVYWVG